MRDESVKTIEARDLVPGDVIIIRLGDIVPADVKILPEEGGGAGEEVPMQVRAMHLVPLWHVPCRHVCDHALIVSLPPTRCPGRSTSRR